MTDLCCDLLIHINGQQTFFLNQRIVSAYSGKMKKMIKKERPNSAQIEILSITLEDFPGGGDGFELVSRFCYNNGRIPITIPTVSTLYCAAVFLGMTEKLSNCNLLQQAESFLEGMFYWGWGDLLVCLKSCEIFFSFADSSGLIDKLITTLLAKIAQNSDISLLCSSNSSSSPSSPDNANVKPSSTRRRSRLSSSSASNHSGANNNRGSSNNNNSNNKAWWFDDLATLCPMMIEKVLRSLGALGSENNSLLLTKFLLHYLKTHKTCSNYSKSEYRGLADTAVYGVILMGKAAFSCRALFWVLRLVSGFGISKVCRTGLERLIGSMLDLAKLDDLLVSGGHNFDGVYDVNLVVRLTRVFVQCEGISIQRLQKVGWLIDQYLAEISPDHNLKISKFIAVAQSLPDFARDCFDGVYRAIDIYIESHPTLSFNERSRLCGCLNYEKLSLESCKDLAKNPRIPPTVAVQALASQKSVNYDETLTTTNQLDYYYESPSKSKGNDNKQIVIYGSDNYEQVVAHHEEEDQDEEEEENDQEQSSFSEESEDHIRLNIQRMQWRVLELEKLCREMKGQMTKLVKHSKAINSPRNNRPPRLC